MYIHVKIEPHSTVKATLYKNRLININIADDAQTTTIYKWPKNALSVQILHDLGDWFRRQYIENVLSDCGVKGA